MLELALNNWMGHDGRQVIEEVKAPQVPALINFILQSNYLMR